MGSEALGAELSHPWALVSLPIVLGVCQVLPNPAWHPFLPSSRLKAISEAALSWRHGCHRFLPTSISEAALSRMHGPYDDCVPPWKLPCLRTWLPCPLPQLHLGSCPVSEAWLCASLAIAFSCPRAVKENQARAGCSLCFFPPWEPVDSPTCCSSSELPKDRALLQSNCFLWPCS